MNSLKAFFTRVTDCCINPASYRDLKDKDISTGMWYLYRLLILTSLVSVLWFAAAVVHAMPKMRAVATEIESELPTLYPAVLVLKFENGELTSNVREPFAIPMPKKWAALAQEADEPVINLAVINTKATAEDYADSNALLLLTKRSFVAGNQDGEMRIFAYEGMDDMTITQKTYKEFMSTVLSGMRAFLPTFKAIVVALFILAPFVGGFFVLLGWMFMLLIYSLILYFFVSITKRGLTYGQIYRLGLFGATPIAIIGMLLWLVGVVQWFASVFFLIWMWIVIRSITQPKKA